MEEDLQLDYDETGLEEMALDLQRLLSWEPMEGAHQAECPEAPRAAVPLEGAAKQTVLFFPGLLCPACADDGVSLPPFQQYDALVRHWREKHSRFAKVFPCPECTYTAKRGYDTRKHFQRRHCRGKRSPRFFEVMKKATPRLVRNPQFIDPGVYVLPRGDGAHLPDPPELLAASSAPSNDPALTPAPSDDPASTPAPSDDPASMLAPCDDPAATQAPSDDSATMPAPTGDFPMPAIPTEKEALRQFIRSARQVIDDWTAAVCTATDQLLKLEQETRRQADQALRGRVRQLEYKRLSVSNLRVQLPKDDCSLSPLSRWGRSRFM